MKNKHYHLFTSGRPIQIKSDPKGLQNWMENVVGCVKRIGILTRYKNVPTHDDDGSRMLRSFGRHRGPVALFCE